MNKKCKHITAWLMLITISLMQPLLCFRANASETSGEDSVNTFHITSAEDLAQLSEMCTSDAWSGNITVILDKDIDLSNTAITPIPTFGGVFLGQNHTLSGITLTGGSDYTGLFRYIQDGGEIYDLHLSGKATAESTHSGLALLAGCNRGLISNCHAAGSVTGGNSVGMLAGLNDVTGVITSGHSDGTVYGNHMTGGIAGFNKGSILDSYNKCDVNTTTSENDINISSLTVSDLLTTENAASVTDIGGIAGSSSGIIRACVNTGAIGYQHVGYNIGGIAGSQTGYIEGCVNYGVLNGRKDVGGIVGQMEPSSEIEYMEDTLDKLNVEFNKLHVLVTKMTDDAGASSDKLTGQIDQLLTSVENAQKVIDDIAAQTSADMDAFSYSLTDISSLPTPEPISLDFLDEIPTPDISPSVSPSGGIFPSGFPTLRPAETPTATPTGTPTATPTETPTATPTGTPTATPTETPAAASLNSGSESAKAYISTYTETYTVPILLSAPDTSPSATPAATPDWTERFEDDLDRIPDFDFDKEEAERELNRVQGNVYEDAQEVLDSMKDTFSSEASVISSRINAHHAALSSSFSSIISDMRLLNNMLNDENQLLLDDFQAITDELNIIENIITAPDTADPDDVITDISDDDKETDITGKVMNCMNKGKIYGDLNVGGIAGAMSRENNLDPEDDLNLADDPSLNVRYKERIVIRQSQNSGVVTGKKNCVGGITGYMTLGSIIECIGTGDVSSDGNMIGGIAGKAEGTIRGSSSKCALSGKDQIGGIAGFGNAIHNCYSMIEIKEGVNYLGSIAGKADTSHDISENYFVEGCPAGIDGINYEGIATPLAYGDFMCLDDLPDIYRNIHLTFMADDRLVSTVTLSYGESFDVNTLPSVPQKEGYSGRWEAFDSSSLTFDQTIDAIYSEYITTLESIQLDNMRPVALIEGTFEAGDRFILSDVDAYPEDSKTKAVCQKISIISGTGPYTVRYLIPEDMENPQIELFENNSWAAVPGYVDGSYYVFSTDKTEFIFSCVDRPQSPVREIIIIASSVLIIFIIFIVLYCKKRKKK